MPITRAMDEQQKSLLEGINVLKNGQEETRQEMQKYQQEIVEEKIALKVEERVGAVEEKVEEDIAIVEEKIERIKEQVEKKELKSKLRRKS
ncbi:hypothetical protein TNCV_4230231 [Trichonephila clavipes]|uniref:Uncharacterized protein n=1 Tax=Trichonephila clavipes TaxID=2585209 RepID=A0A8X6VG80_TRICX|nr:hypothetical protein TNCV_4230231 [Trichonephila clavipes]